MDTQRPTDFENVPFPNGYELRLLRLAWMSERETPIGQWQSPAEDASTRAEAQAQPRTSGAATSETRASDMLPTGRLVLQAILHDRTWFFMLNSAGWVLNNSEFNIVRFSEW